MLRGKYTLYMHRPSRIGICILPAERPIACLDEVETFGMFDFQVRENNKGPLWRLELHGPQHSTEFELTTAEKNMVFLFERRINAIVHMMECANYFIEHHIKTTFGSVENFQFCMRHLSPDIETQMKMEYFNDTEKWVRMIEKRAFDILKNSSNPNTDYIDRIRDNHVFKHFPVAAN